MSAGASSGRHLAVAIAAWRPEGSAPERQREAKLSKGRIYVGIGGWTFEPWRGVFYPEGLTQKRELEYASRALTSIEINGTYYSSFKPAIWQVF